MNKNKKIIFSTIAIVLILAIVGVILYSVFRKPTIGELFDKNREYFSTLQSLETEIRFEHSVEKTNDNNSSINWNTSIQQHISSETTFLNSTYEIEKNGKVFQTLSKLYVSNENEQKERYYNEVFNNIDNGWVTNKIGEHVETLLNCQTFNIVESFSNSFILDNEIAVIDGISCYKATARCFRPEIIADAYNVRNIIGSWMDLFFEFYIDMTVYFREDTWIIYKVEYDLTDLQHRIYEMNYSEELLSGSSSITVLFKNFNNFDEIKVPDEIKNSAKEHHGNEIEDPIDIDDELYRVTGLFSMNIGDKISDYSELFTIKQVQLKEDVEDPEIIEVGDYAHFIFTDEKNNTFSVQAQNCSDAPVHYSECNIISISIDSTQCPDFDKIGISDKINMKYTLQDCKKLLGRYTHEFENDIELQYKWRSYIDYCEIEINFNKDTGEITSFAIWSWDLLYYMNK